MPAPSTVDEFLDLIRKSGVVEEKRLNPYLDKARAGGKLPIDPKQLAALMIRDSILTHFQAEQILQGKWKRFTIGKYKVLEPLGAGGMGTVYLCEHKLMRRRVAIKILPFAKAKDPSYLERFYREARAVAALDHPNIVRAHDIDHDGKLHFLVMEYVDGASLQDIISKRGPMDWHRVAHYLSQGATVYFCLTGQTIFGEGTAAQKLIWHQTRQPKPIRSHRPEVPQELCDLIEKKMLAKDAAQRFQTPMELVDALAPLTETPI